MRALFCATLLIVLAVPIAAAGFTLTEPGLAPGPLWSYNHAIARNNTRQLAVWMEPEGLKGALLELDGRSISPRSFRIDDVVQTNTLQLFGTGDTFTLIANTNEAMLWLTIDSAGNVLDRRQIDLGGYPLTSFAWTGEHFGVVISKHGRTEALLLGLDGAMAHGPFTFNARNETLRLTAVGDGILIGSDTRLRRLTRDGVEEIARGSFRTPFAATATRSGWLLASAEPQPQGTTGLVVMNVDRSGVHSDVIASAQVLTPLAFLETAGGYALVFDTYASVDSILLDRNGIPVDGSRKTRIHSRALAAHADGATIAVLTATRANGTQRIRATQLGPHAPLRSVLVSTTAANQTTPIGAGFGDTALLAFTEVRSAPIIQLVSLTGQKPRLIQSIEGSRIVSPTLPSNGMEALLLHHSGTSLYATRLAPDGTALDADATRISDAAPSPRASATWTGSQWVIAWLDTDDSRAIRLARLDGTDVDELRSILPHPRTPAYAHRIVEVELYALRSGFMLAWQEYPICSMPCVGSDGIVATLDENGSLRAITKVAMSSSTLSTATDGDAIVLVEGGQARFFEESAETLALRDTWRFRDWHPQTHIVWDGDEYVTGAAYNLTTPRLAIDRFRAPTEQQRRKITDQLNPRLAGPLTVVPLDEDDSIVLTEERTADGHRVVAYRESHMIVAPPAPPPPQRVQRRPGTNNATIWEWEPPSSGVIDGYAVEVVYGTWSYITASLPPDARQYTTHSNVRIRAFNDGGLSSVQSDRRRTVRP